MFRIRCSYRHQNNRFSNARQNVQYYQIFTGHFKNPSDIMPGNPVNLSTAINLIKQM